MEFDCIVIGGGHAGIEAAAIAARKNISVLMITSHLDLIGQMSCNPAIGGIAKGNIVREIDSLGGLMGRIIDKSGIHFKMLNQSKGMAVWGPRAQADKRLYRFWARTFIEQMPNVAILQGMVKRLLFKGSSVVGIEMDSSEKILCKAVVLAAGTFLQGTVHIGLTHFSAGRTGEPESSSLTESITQLGVEASRLKTGTSPRIDSRSVDLSKMEPQEGDVNPWPFSFSTKEPLHNRAVCYATRTNAQVHAIILDNLDRSPLYTKKVVSSGPRYCPSIEDKVVRFGERDGHTLFLEPEGLDVCEMYLNGLSTSLPFDVQIQMVHAISGLENARILRPGYGIEYDYFQPLQLKVTLESKAIANLFFAGQINGTSGYEEAACQGLIAGINAAANILGEEPFVLGRETSYTGVLIDDLVTKGTQEPYRMFTSRAEYRLLLRQDTADERLMPLAAKRGLISDDVWIDRQRAWETKRMAMRMITESKIYPEQWKHDDPKAQILHPTHGDVLLLRPEVSIDQVCSAINYSIDNREIKLGVEADIKYRGFIIRQKQEIDRQKESEYHLLPEWINYIDIPGLLNEARQKLISVRPRSLGQAMRIPGLTPADITVLMIYLAKVRGKSSENVSRET